MLPASACERQEMDMRTAAAFITGIALSAAGAAIAIQTTVRVEAADAADCVVAALQAKAPKGTTITAATPVAATDKVPAYCRVEGRVATPGNQVDFRLG